MARNSLTILVGVPGSPGTPFIPKEEKIDLGKDHSSSGEIARPIASDLAQTPSPPHSFGWYPLQGVPAPISVKKI